MWQAWIYWGRERGREGTKSTSVLLVFLSEFNLNNTAGGILLLLKKASLAFQVLWKEKNLHLKS